MSDRDDRVRDGIFLDTLDRRGNGHGFYSSSGPDMYHGHHRYHSHRRSDKGYFSDEFKKAKPPKFVGQLKKSEDVEAWLLGMKKLFVLHD